MSFKKVLELAQKYAEKTIVAPGPNNVNQQFQAQREKLFGFYDQFFPELRRCTFRLENEIGTLHMRGFDHKMIKLMTGVFAKLLGISKNIKEDKPYKGATELVDFILSRHTKSMIDNLDFIANHHLKVTNEDFKESSNLTNPKVESFKQIIHLAEWARGFMEMNPLLPLPSSPPPAMPIGPVPTASPEEKVSEMAMTNPAIPLAKRRDDVGQ